MAQVADVVPLMYGGFLAFFLGVTVFLVRRLNTRRGCGPHAPLRQIVIQALAHPSPARSTSS